MGFRNPNPNPSSNLTPTTDPPPPSEPIPHFLPYVFILVHLRRLPNEGGPHSSRRNSAREARVFALVCAQIQSKRMIIHPKNNTHTHKHEHTLSENMFVPHQRAEHVLPTRVYALEQRKSTYRASPASLPDVVAQAGSQARAQLLRPHGRRRILQVVVLVKLPLGSQRLRGRFLHRHHHVDRRVAWIQNKTKQNDGMGWEGGREGTLRLGLEPSSRKKKHCSRTSVKDTEIEGTPPGNDTFFSQLSRFFLLCQGHFPPGKDSFYSKNQVCP